MYNEDKAVTDFLAGEYRNVSQLTLGSEEVARLHDQTGTTWLADIHRMPIDVAREVLIFIQGADQALFEYAVEWVLGARDGS